MPALDTATILAKIATNLPDNTTRLITPALLRDVVNNMATSYENIVDTGPVVTSFGGVTGAVAAGTGLSMAGNTLNASANVTSFGGVTGAVSVGTNLSMAGNTLNAAANVSSLGGVSGAISVGSGLTISGSVLNAQPTVSSLGGVSGAITLGTNLSMAGSVLNAAGGGGGGGGTAGYVVSTTTESGHILSASTKALWDISCVIGAVSGWLLLIDAGSIPVDGAVTPIHAVPIFSDGVQGFYEKAWPTGLAFATGIIAVFSTTGPFTKTASATAFFSGQVS